MVFFCPFSHWNEAFPVAESITFSDQGVTRPGPLAFDKQPLATRRTRSVRSVCPLLFRITCLIVLTLVLFQPASGWSEENPSSSPQRIVSMSPGITEILFALGVGDRVVGVTDFCNYPEATKSIAKIGGLLNPSYETLITLKPDLIVHQPDSHKVDNFVEKLGIRGLPVSMLSLEQIFDTIQTIGAATGSDKKAGELIRQMKDEIQSYRTRLAGISTKSVLLVLGISNHSMRDIYGVGPNTYLDELLTIAGGENLLADSHSSYPKISKEFIIHKSPEVIIEVGPTRILTSEANISRKAGWKKFSTIRAVKNNAIHFVASDYVLIPGPRLINIIADFAKAIHPGVFQNVAPSTSGSTSK